MQQPLFIAFFVVAYTCAYAQGNAKFCAQTQALERIVSKEHITPKPLNDSLSTAVFELFLQQLDPDRRLFLKSDISNFEQDKFKFDDYIRDRECAFITKYIDTLQRRLSNSKLVIGAHSSETLDYTGKDSLNFDSKMEFSYFKDEAAVKKYWSKKIRYRIISLMMDEDSIYENIKTNFASLEARLKPKVIERELCLLDEILNQFGGVERFVQEAFLNAYANYHDPNTLFFNNTEKTVFETSLSSNQLSFGFMTSKNNDGEVQVDYISPGSAAHRNKDFEEGDIIKTIASGKDSLDMVCVSSEDVQTFIQDPHHNTMTFGLKKKDGSQKMVTLQKAKIKVEENSVHGFVLSKSSDIGYIQIPSFYTDFESANGQGVANDVAKELYKLEKENIKGLILDLRFNGGGSMKEAADLCGMFINRGPLSILKYNTGELYTVKDNNRGMLFKKPIIILINGFSASASELFSSTMQDYNRAIIVGAASYGKSSAQVVLPLQEGSNMGFSKITVDQFYRVTGKSIQSQGVLPDISLPSLYDHMETGEKYLKFTLVNDSVTIQTKFNPLKKVSIASLKAKSKERVSKNMGFKNIQDYNQILLDTYINKSAKYALTLDNLYNDLNAYYTNWKEYHSNFESYTSSLSVRNSVATDIALQKNEGEKQSNEMLLNEITKDVHIEEAYTILIELIESLNLK